MILQPTALFPSGNPFEFSALLAHKYAMGSNGLLQVIAVTKNYRTGENLELPILRGIDLNLSEGESLAIIGPSGSGKSTLLNIIGTLDEPSAGEVLFRGRKIVGLKPKELAELRNRELGFVFQSHHLLPQCSLLENVLVPTLATKSADRSGALERGKLLLKRAGLAERLSHFPSQLSGGERQRVAVVRALINQPRLLLADEPTGALDRSSAEQVGNLLLDLNREEKVALIVVTHSLDLAKRMSRIEELREGKLVKTSVP